MDTVYCMTCGEEIVLSEDGSIFLHAEVEVFDHIARPDRSI